MQQIQLPKSASIALMSYMLLLDVRAWLCADKASQDQFSLFARPKVLVLDPGPKRLNPAFRHKKGAKRIRGQRPCCGH
jgi:hypothetical protein